MEGRALQTASAQEKEEAESSRSALHDEHTRSANQIDR